MRASASPSSICTRGGRAHPAPVRLAGEARHDLLQGRGKRIADDGLAHGHQKGVVGLDVAALPPAGVDLGGQVRRWIVP